VHSRLPSAWWLAVPMISAVVAACTSPPANSPGQPIAKTSEAAKVSPPALLDRPTYTVSSPNPWVMTLVSAQYAAYDSADGGVSGTTRFVLRGTAPDALIALVFACAPAKATTMQSRVAEAFAERPSVEEGVVGKFGIVDWLGRPAPPQWIVVTLFDTPGKQHLLADGMIEPNQPIRVAYLADSSGLRVKDGSLHLSWGEATSVKKWTIPFPFGL
jgi:hypothetical protein